MIRFWCPCYRKPSQLILALIIVLALSLCSAGLATAHGGEGDELRDPAPTWMIGLIYVQLFMIPVVGVWLVNEAVSAWLRPVSKPNNHGAKYDTFK